MISYEVNYKLPINTTKVTLMFGGTEVEKVVPKDVIKDGLCYIYNDREFTSIEVGNELHWILTHVDEKGLTVVDYTLTAPCQDIYVDKIVVDLPREFYDKATNTYLTWRTDAKNPNPIADRQIVGNITNFKISFSALVKADDVLKFVKIAGRDAIMSEDGNEFRWPDPTGQTSDIYAPYSAVLDQLICVIPEDVSVCNIGWSAKEPIPIEQMYHKTLHAPFFPVTSFSAVYDTNGNALSTIATDLTERVRAMEPIVKEGVITLADHEKRIRDIEALTPGTGAYEEIITRISAVEEGEAELSDKVDQAEEDLDETKTKVEGHDWRITQIEKAIGGEVDLSKYIQHKDVTGLAEDIPAEESDRTIFHLTHDTVKYPVGYYIFTGLNNPDGTAQYVRIDNVDAAAGVVKDVKVDGTSVVNADGVAEIDTAAFGKVKDVTINGTTAVDPVTGVADIDLDSKADKATTLAGYEIADAYTKAEVDAKITAMATGEVGTIGKYIQKIKEENGIITATVADVKQTYSATDTEPISGAGVKAAIDELDVADTAVAKQYVSQVQQVDGKISVTRADIPVNDVKVGGTTVVDSSTKEVDFKKAEPTETKYTSHVDPNGNIIVDATTKLEVIGANAAGLVLGSDVATVKKYVDDKIEEELISTVKADETTKGKANQYGFFSADNTLTGKKLADVYSKTETGDNKTKFDEGEGTYVVPTTTAVKGYLNDVLGGITGAMVFKGDETNINPAEFTENSVGWTYIIKEEGTYQGMDCKPGDMLVIKSYPVTGPESWVHINTPTVVVPDDVPEVTLTDTTLATIAGVNIKTKLKDAKVEYKASTEDADAKLESKETAGTVTGKDIAAIKDYIDDVNKVKDVKAGKVGAEQTIVNADKIAIIPVAATDKLGIAKLDTDKIHSTSTAKTFDATEPTVLSAKAVEDSLAFKKVDGQTGAAVLTDSNGTASATNAVAMGSATTASGVASVAMGVATTASDVGAIAGGTGAKASNTSLAFGGVGTEASGLFSVALGQSVASKDRAFAVGKATASANYAVAAGNGAQATGVNAVAMGLNSVASGLDSLAASGATAEGEESIALGSGSLANKKNSVAIGVDAKANGEESLAIIGGIATGKTSLAMWDGNEAKGERSIAGGAKDADGNGNIANGANSIAFGVGTTTTEDGITAIALGEKTVAGGKNSIATGLKTETTNALEVAMGTLNLSHTLDESDPKPEKTTLASIGVGEVKDDGTVVKKNALEVTDNGDIYVLGVGNYDGTELKDPYVDESHPGNDIKDLATTINDLDFATTSAIHDLNEKLETLDRVSADADVVLNNKLEVLDRVSADADLALNKKIDAVDYVTALALHDLEDRKVAEVVGEGDVQVTRDGDTVKVKVNVPKVDVETYNAGTNITIKDLGNHEHQINAPQLQLDTYEYTNSSGYTAYKTEDRISLKREQDEYDITYKIHLDKGVPKEIRMEGTFGPSTLFSTCKANEGITKIPVAGQVLNSTVNNFGVVAFAEGNSTVDTNLSKYQNSSQTYYGSTMRTGNIVDYIRQYSASYRGTVTATQLNNMSAATPSYYGTTNHLGKLPYEGWIVETAAAGEYTLDPVPAVVKATLPKGTFLIAVVNPRSTSRLLWKVLEMPADEAFNENSTNAVQNKVITKYIKENETTVAAALHELRDVELPLRDEEIEKRKTFDVTVAGASIVNENGVAEIPELGKIDQVLIGGVDYHGTTEETRKIVSIPCKYEPATDPVTNPLSKFTVGDQVAEIFSDEAAIKLYIKNLLKQVLTYDPVTNSLTADLTKLD